MKREMCEGRGNEVMRREVERIVRDKMRKMRRVSYEAKKVRIMSKS